MEQGGGTEQKTAWMGLPVRVVFLLDKYPVGVYDANEIGMSVLGKVDRKAIYRLKGGTPMREEVYDISGMHCAACSASVEKVTRRLPGVERSDVNLVAERMTIVYDETQVTPEQIIAKVEKAGFGAKLHQEKQEAAPVQTGEDPEEAELRRKKRELIVSAIFSCALLYVSMGQMLPFGLPALPLPDLFSMHTHPMNFAVLQLMLAIPVLYCGRNFFINGFQALFHGNPNMDSLVAIGSACSFVYSVVMMFLITDDVHGHVHNLYYESSAVVLTLVSLGKFMESRNMKKTKSAITALMRLTPICPHSTRSSSYVLSPEHVITVEAADANRKFVYLSVDGGKAFSLKNGDQVRVSTSKYTTRLVRLSKKSFCEILDKKMGTEASKK